jgi:hypothetical protein
VLCSIVSQWLFANVFVRSSREQPFWVLSLEGIETDLMPRP